MLKSLVKKALNDLLPTLKRELFADLISHFGGIYKLDPKSQYMIVVKDEETAQQLVKEINERFETDSRLIVLAAEEVNVVQFTKRRQ